jgi:hypothetical protein
MTLPIGAAFAMSFAAEALAAVRQTPRLSFLCGRRLD